VETTCFKDQLGANHGTKAVGHASRIWRILDKTTQHTQNGHFLPKGDMGMEALTPAEHAL
jgi:hypothetical protein